jgi:hypothetical protein
MLSYFNADLRWFKSYVSGQSSFATRQIKSDEWFASQTCEQLIVPKRHDGFPFESHIHQASNHSQQVTWAHEPSAAAM